MKRLFLSQTDKKLAGVCGGLAEYLNIDSVLLRLIFIFIVIFTGLMPGIVFYLLAILTVPKRTEIT